MEISGRVCQDKPLHQKWLRLSIGSQERRVTGAFDMGSSKSIQVVLRQIREQT